MVGWMDGWETEGVGGWFIPEGNGYVHLVTRRGGRGGERVGWREDYGRLSCEGKKNLHPNECACGEASVKDESGTGLLFVDGYTPEASSCAHREKRAHFDGTSTHSGTELFPGMSRRTPTREKSNKFYRIRQNAAERRTQRNWETRKV